MKRIHSCVWNVWCSVKCHNAGERKESEVSAGCPRESWVDTFNGCHLLLCDMKASKQILLLLWAYSCNNLIKMLHFQFAKNTTGGAGEEDISTFCHLDYQVCDKSPKLVAEWFLRCSNLAGGSASSVIYCKHRQRNEAAGCARVCVCVWHACSHRIGSDPISVISWPETIHQNEFNQKKQKVSYKAGWSKSLR